MTLSTQSISFTLGKNELLTPKDVLNPELRWMVIKVKQRSMIKYEDLIPSQVGQSTKDLPSQQSLNAAGQSSDTNALTTEAEEYPIGFNWPYDYLSIVESIKFDVKVLYKPTDENIFAGADDGQIAGAKEMPGLSSTLYNSLARPGGARQDKLKRLPGRDSLPMPESEGDITLNQVGQAVIGLIKEDVLDKKEDK